MSAKSWTFDLFSFPTDKSNVTQARFPFDDTTEDEERAKQQELDSRLGQHPENRPTSLLFKMETQGVRKVPLQFQQFITKANEKTDKWKLLQNETYIFKFSLCLI